MKVIINVNSRWGSMFLGGICFIALYRGNLQGDTEELIDILIREGMPVDTYEFDNEVARVLRYGFKLGTALYTVCDEQNLPAAAHYSNMAQIHMV